MKRNEKFLSTVISVCLVAGAVIAAADPTESDPREEVVAALEATNAAVRGGISPTGLAEMLFAPDVISLGEGEIVATRGIKANAAAVAEHWAGSGPDGQKKCTQALTDDPGVFSGDTYASFFTHHCDANPPAVTEAVDIRGIYVWKKLPQGWRVALVHWGVGKL